MFFSKKKIPPNLFSLSARHNYIQALTTPLGGHVKGEVRYAPLQGKLHTLHLSHNAMRQVCLKKIKM